MNDRERIGLRLMQLRQEKGLSQRDLSKIAGVTQKTIYKVEKGLFSVGLDVLCRITDALACDVDIKERNGYYNPID